MELIKKAKGKIRSTFLWLKMRFQVFSYIFKNSIWPILFWELRFTAIALFFAGVYLLTMSGLTDKLTNDYQQLFGILTSTIGTMIAIFFSLILLPLNQIATKYSPKFLKHIKKDPQFILIFVYSIISLIYDIIFLYLGSSKNIALAGILMFVFFIFLLGFFVWHVIYMLDAKNSILTPIHEEIVKEFRKMIPTARKNCERSFENMLGEEFKDDQYLKNVCLLNVDVSITNYIQENILPIREVAIKAIKDLDLEQAKNAMQTMMSIVVNYLYSRRLYHSDDDPILYFIYTEFELIVNSSNNELKLSLHPFIVECWRLIGTQAATVNIKGMKRLGENLNFLVQYPILGLKELCAFHLLEKDSYVPGKACDALGEIGVKLMLEGYDRQAAIVIQELEKISIIAKQAGVNNVSGSANYAIMKIYVNGLYHRNTGGKDNHNFVYRDINKSIDNLLENFLKNKLTTFDNMILSPFIGGLVDPLKGLNFSIAAEYGIFNPELSEFSIKMNFTSIQANTNSIAKSLNLLTVNKDWYFSNQALENLYRTLLILLSYINENMAKDHIIYYKSHPVITEELFEKCSDIIMDSIKILIDLAGSNSEKYLFENDHLNILFSFYLIVLYEYKIRPNEKLKDLFEEIHLSIKNLLTEYELNQNSKSNDVLYKYYRLLIDVLNENNFQELAADFDVPKFEYRSSAGMSFYHESQYPKTMLDSKWIIKRPGFQRNAYYYNRIESALKLNTLEFF